MARITIHNFAKQVGISLERLLDKLQQAGITGKTKSDYLTDDEKSKLLESLKGNLPAAADTKPLTLKRKTTNEIRQTSRTGAARTVQVEVKKRRTFVKRSLLEAKQADAARQVQNEIEQKRQLALQKQQDDNLQDISPQFDNQDDESDVDIAAPGQTAPPEVDGIDGNKKPQTKNDSVQDIDGNVAEKRPADTESKSKPALKKPAPGKKSKRGKRGGKRRELHVAKGRNNKTRRKPLRKHGRISSAISDAHAFAKPTEPMVREVKVPESISVGNLAQAMSIKAGEVIKAMMQMGTMVTINQLLDQDTAILVVEEMGHKAAAVDAIDPEALLAAADIKIDGGQLQSRPPVVTVMGHVDHGKTSLLDYLRNAKVAGGEAGGITQHIGAYKVRLKQGEICFLDTPGHEAFSAMRARGAESTDLVILVVAADDGVMPQTVEAIRHARAAAVPIIVAINKIDREEADVEKVKQDLAKHEVISEAWGGEVLMNEISALDGRGVEELLNSVLLQAEVLDLKARADGPAGGRIIEARLDKGRGPVATALIQRGQLNKGDIVLTGRESGRVRVLTDDRGQVVDWAGPSTPVEIQGLAGVPVAGDDLFVVSDEKKAREIALYRQGKYKEVNLAKQQKGKLESMFNKLGDGETKSLNLLIKADVQGSVEALSEAMEKLSVEDVQVKIVHAMVGGVTESDVNLAAASAAYIIGFNVRADNKARRAIEKHGITVQYHNIIYDVIDAMKAAMSGLLAPIINERQVGLVEVRDVFRAPKIGAVAGSYVAEGMVRRNLPVRVLRDNIVIFEGAIDSLKRFKEDVVEVKNGLECGIGIRNYNDVKAGDQIEVFEIIETSRQL